MVADLTAQAADQDRRAVGASRPLRRLQMAEAALPRQVAGILTLTNGLRGPPAVTVSA